MVLCCVLTMYAHGVCVCADVCACVFVIYVVCLFACSFAPSRSALALCVSVPVASQAIWGPVKISP